MSLRGEHLYHINIGSLRPIDLELCTLSIRLKDEFARHQEELAALKAQAS